MRREVIELSFSTVLQDGQVGEMVLAYLRQAAPPDLYKTFADLYPIRANHSVGRFYPRNGDAMLKAKRGEVKNKERRFAECRNSPDPRGDRSPEHDDGAVSLNPYSCPQACQR
jgi:hypothetical protein